jgi:hypothetical protein
MMSFSYAVVQISLGIAERFLSTKGDFSVWFMRSRTCLAISNATILLDWGKGRGEVIAVK